MVWAWALWTTVGGKNFPPILCLMLGDIDIIAGILYTATK